MDFRFLNSKIRKGNVSFPLIREAMSVIGGSKCKYMSFIDLKDAYHSLNLSPKCQKYCGISSYFGGLSYFFYKTMPQGLSMSPAEWQTKIECILSELPNHKMFTLAIMDDLSIFSKTKEEHFKYIALVLGILKKYGLKISIKKCKFFI